ANNRSGQDHGERRHLAEDQLHSDAFLLRGFAAERAGKCGCIQRLSGPGRAGETAENRRNATRHYAIRSTGGRSRRWALEVKMPVPARSTRQTGVWRCSSTVCLPRGYHLGLLALLIALLASLAGCGASIATSATANTSAPSPTADPACLPRAHSGDLAARVDAPPATFPEALPLYA